MNKPQGYDNYQVGGGKKLPAGGYICNIMNVEETKSKSGKDMIVISLDIKNGEYKDYYADKYKANKNINKKWGCNVYALTEGEYTNTFMGFCKSVELSNAVAISWGDNFGTQFKGKTVGVVFSEEEFQGDNGILVSVKPRYFLPVESIESGNFNIPEKKRLANPQPAANCFHLATDIDDEDLPF
ncbi:MAG: DUF669 domain-containing protein [Lachnospirales bacterium]